MKFRLWTAISIACALLLSTSGTSFQASNRLASSATSTISNLRLINYYPGNHAWWYMWSQWSPQSINADFNEIETLHANAIRIYVFPQTFGYPQPSSIMVQHLKDVLTMAQQHSLQVMIAFFDFWNDYSDISGSRQWLSALLSGLNDDPRIVAVDLQNEMPNSDPQAITWAQNLVPYLHTLLGSIPVTVSVSGKDGIAGLHRLIDAGLTLDFYDLHYYGGAALTHLWAQQAQQVAGTTPLYIGETGYSTALTNDPVGGLVLNKQQEESYQSQHYREVSFALHSLRLPYPGSWVYTDFSAQAIPPDGPAQDPLEYSYGLVRLNGSWKPAARAMAYIFGGGSVDTAFNNGFEYGDPGGMPLLWRLWQSSSATFARDSTVAHSGGASARISNSGDGPNFPGFFTSPIKFIDAGKTYNASVWSRGLNATGVNQISLAWFDINGNYLTKSTSLALPLGTTTWTVLSVQSVAPSAAAYVQIHLESSGNTGSVWFDDVSFG